MMAASFFSPAAISASTRDLKLLRASATAAFKVSMALAQFASEPTARNSKRLPVKANGDVLLRSVLSMKSSGIEGRSSLKDVLPSTRKESRSALSTMSRSSVTFLPRNEEMIAGGASLAPRRWALEADIMLALSRPLWSRTAFRVSTVNVTKRRLSIGVLPGA